MRDKPASSVTLSFHSPFIDPFRPIPNGNLFESSTFPPFSYSSICSCFYSSAGNLKNIDGSSHWYRPTGLDLECLEPRRALCLTTDRTVLSC